MSKTVLVTGSSRGIGAATVRLAARRGWDVVINYMNSSAAAEALAEEVQATGRKAHLVQADIGSPASIASMFEEIDRAAGYLDAVVCNAGITGKAGRLEDLEDDTLRRVVDVNLIGAMTTAREAVRRMSTTRGGRGGSIVLMSTVASFIGGAGEWLHYAASKGAINTFTLGLSREVAGEGIRVNAVSPGVIDTDIHAAAGLADRVARLGPTLPMQRIGTTDEVAEAILFFMRGEAAYAIGAVLPITGGR